MSSIGKQIFHLIQSMETKDKRYFKLYVNRYHQSNQKATVVLFDIINGLDTYEEEIVLKKANKKGVKNLHFVKNQLKKELLNAITDLHFNTTEEDGIGNIINKIDIGIKYQMTSLSNEWIEKGRNLFPKGEEPSFQLLLDVKKLGFLEYNPVTHQDELETLYEQHQQHIHLLQNELAYRKLRTQVFAWYIKYKDHASDLNLEKLETICQNPLFQDDSLALTYDSKRYLYFTKSLYYRTHKNMDKYLFYSQKTVDLSLSNPQYLEVFSNSVLSDIFNHIQSKIAIGILDEVEQDLAKFEEACSSIKIKDVLYNRFRYFYTLLVCAYNSKRNQTQKTIDFTQNKLFIDLKKGTKTYLHLSLIYFCIIEAHFLKRDIENTLKWVENYYNHKYKRKTIDSEIVIRFFEIACHYEEGNYALCTSLISRFKYLQKKHTIKSKELKVLLRLFKYLLAIQENYTHKQDHSSCIASLQSIAKFDYQRTLAYWGIEVLQKIDKESYI